jgi:anaerobic selenocysteine-containing dehydrogenase
MSEPWKHHAKVVNGFRMHYVIAGSGYPLVLLHGWPQSWYEWRSPWTTRRAASRAGIITPEASSPTCFRARSDPRIPQPGRSRSTRPAKASFNRIEDVVGALSNVPITEYCEISGVEESLVRAAARRIARASSVAVFEDLGVQMNRHSTLVSYLEKLVWLLTGNLGKPGAQ